MSSDQHRLTAFTTPQPDERDERPNWEPTDGEATDTGARTKCEVCGASASSDFARVFGDNDDRLVNGCLSCSTMREIISDDRVGPGPAEAGGRL